MFNGICDLMVYLMMLFFVCLVVRHVNCLSILCALKSELAFSSYREKKESWEKPCSRGEMIRVRFVSPFKHFNINPISGASSGKRS